MPTLLDIPLKFETKRQTAKPLRFFVDNLLVTQTTDDDLEQITGHLNHLFAKTTDLRFQYAGFEIVPDDHVIVGDPSLSFDVRIKPGNPSMSGVRNDAIVAHTPEVRSDNYGLCDTIAHEGLHIFGLWEYNANWTMRDFSGVTPLADMLDGTGHYWDSRQLPRLDPLMGFGGWGPDGKLIIHDMQSWLDKAMLCPLSSFVVNGIVRSNDFLDTRGSRPTNPVTVEVRTEPNAIVDMYIIAQSPRTQTLVFPWRTKIADADGVATFPWDGEQVIATQGNHARLFRAELMGRVGKEWLTWADLWAGKVMPNGGAEGDWHYHGHLPITLS